MKLLEMGKDLKINHSFSSLHLGKLFFAKRLCIGEQRFWSKFMGGGGGLFYTGTNDQIMEGGKLMVKRFQRSSQVSFPLIYPDLGY